MISNAPFIFSETDIALLTTLNNCDETGMGFIDLFKHPSEKKIHQPAPLQTLPQLGI